jgi:hypothetical protein
MATRLMRNVLREWFWTAKLLRLDRLEKHVEELEQCSRALKRVYHISKEQLKDSCEGCAKTLSISRRCMSPGAEGAPTKDKEQAGYVHAIVVGESSVQFCLQCRGQQDDNDDGHAPRMSGFLAAL